MKKRSEITAELYSIIREFFITFSVQYGIFKCLNWEIPSLILFIISLFIVLSIRFVKDYMWKKTIILVPIIFLLMTLVLRVFYNIDALLFIKNALIWNYTYLKKMDEFNISYCTVTICILSVIIMKIILFVEKNIIAKFITTVGLVTFMVICAMFNIEWNSFIIGIMLFCCLGLTVEICQEKYGGLEGNSEKCLVPFVAVTVLLAICVPSDKEPIEWKWAKNTVNSIGENIQDVVYNLEYAEDNEKNEFSVNKVGLSETKTKIGGNFIDKNERTMLLVDPGYYNMKIGYLSGIIRSKYTGNGWEENEAEDNNNIEEYKMDLYEKLYNIYYSDIKLFPNEYFARKIHYKIGFDKISTKTVFRPENCYSIDDIANEINIDEIGDNLYFHEKQKKGHYYYVSALIINMNNVIMKHFLEELNENEGYYKEKNNEKLDLKGSAFGEAVNELMLSEKEIRYITSDNFRKSLLERSKKIKERYLQIPAETPDRVHKLAKEITENYTNQYDKADAIYKYLKTNYTYETNLNALPEGKDAVDYFLFEEKSGYCTYFASAMAILCRSIDIPVRYVEGATINYKENDDDWYLIKTGASHAWTEIYLDGFGWIRMDPTPGNSLDMASWGIDNSNQSNKQIDESLQVQSNKNIQVNNLDAVEKSYSIVSWIKYIFMGSVLLSLFVLSGIGLFRWNQKMIYKKSNNYQKVLICMKKIMVIIEKQGYTLKQSETLNEFIIRLENGESFVDNETIKLLGWFQIVRYSKKTITDDEVFFVEQFLASK